MALNKIKATPALPYPGRGRTFADLAQFDQDLVRALFLYLTEMATRVNLSAMVSEGTFSPELEFGGAGVGITYATQTGSFKRVGPLVFATGQITLTSKGSSTGAATILNLPAGITDQAGGRIHNYTLTGLTMPPQIEVAGSVASLTYTSGATDIAVNDTHFTNTSTFRFTVVYEGAE